MYDADFLHVHKTRDWQVFGHNYWCQTGPKAYRDPTASTRALVFYAPVRARAAAAPVSAHAMSPFAYGPAIPSGMHASLMYAAPASSEAMHIQDTSAIDALGPQAPSDGVEMAAPKPTKRKKKFLQADAGAVL